jgi:hypothetical protein
LLTTAVPSNASSSENAIVPVSCDAGRVSSVTVAVKTIRCPYVDGFTLDTTATDGVAAAAIAELTNTSPSATQMAMGIDLRFFIIESPFRRPDPW